MLSKNRMPHIITIVSVVMFIVLGLASATTEPATKGDGQAAQTGDNNTEGPFFTGDGGKGMRLAVLEPSVNGLTDDEKKWMPSTIQGSITGDFNRFSAMTIIDRQNFEKILAEQTLSMSGDFSDEDYVRIGHLINARYILVGSVTKTATAYMLELSVTDLESGERKASYPPTPVSPLNLENLTAVKAATASLLQQLGVKLTDSGQQELGKAPDTQAVRAEIALARGITAQRQGTEVAALSYFFQAETLNPTLLEATNRSSVLNANISSGNIGENVRNDIVWRRNWVTRLTEAEQSFDQFNKTESMLFTLFYSDEIKQGAVNYQNETVTLSVDTYLRPSHTWGRTVGVSMQRTLRAVYDGLQATKRAGEWSLQNWPRQGVTNLNSFTRRNNSFTIAAELLNDKNQVIGRQSFRADGWWEYTYNNQTPVGVRVSDDVGSTVNFTVKADDITDRLTIRIASVNGVDAETAARNGVLQIRALPKAEYAQNVRLNSLFRFAFGEIRGPVQGTKKEDFARDEFEVYIPSVIWGDQVVSIGREAFSQFKYETHTFGSSSYNSYERSVLVPPASVYLPDSVTFIGVSAFFSSYVYNAQYGWSRYFGPSRVSIGANVTMVNDSFAYGFGNAYTRKNKIAGIYKHNPVASHFSFSDYVWDYSAR